MMNDRALNPWPVYGHDWAVTFLQKSLAHHRIRHAYLFLGPENIGKRQLAHAFAMALMCENEDEFARPCMQCASCKRILSGNHPDMLYSQADDNTGALRIDAIRDVMRLIALKPFSSSYRIAIFEDFDNARPQAQDALLKTLEEPPPHAVIILLAQSTEHIMSTITSRCQVLRLRPASTDTVQEVLRIQGATDEQADLIGRLSNGRIGWALEALHDEAVLADRDQMLTMLYEAIMGNRAARFAVADELAKLPKQSVRYILETWQTYWRDLLLLSENSPVKPCNSDRRAELEQIVVRLQPEAALHALQATRELLLKTLNTNANVRLALEAMFLDYPHL
ncbi:DNA polymerase III subunit delta' [Phototrophicus methaneseepsis]|uniref:DNA polymerase III subunit delta n=1 Tax=Phototrophicus methaneseepsis TaxID=2710758 RepID=A0A7S8IG31_9CHLR|nr:DNA polymerase III subunit delta' [Phototrophicus methaneseepsis]QPC83548.1 DNA polymerase III subunit delta' [Phototrophicus methaneseepsis]